MIRIGPSLRATVDTFILLMNVVMQDFYWCVEEKPEKGQYVNLSEMSRFIISDEVSFCMTNFRYPYGRDDREVT